MNKHAFHQSNLVAITIVLTLTSQLIAGETIVDDARGFTLTLPDGFVASPELVGTAPNNLHAFVSGDPTGEEIDFIFFIEKVHGTIARAPFKKEDIPSGFKGRIFTVQWQGFEVECVEIPERLGELATMTYGSSEKICNTTTEEDASQ